MTPNDSWLNITIRVLLIIIAAVIIIVLITYYSKPQEKPKDVLEKDGIEKFNVNETKKVQFSDPLVTNEDEKTIIPKEMLPQPQAPPKKIVSTPMPFGSERTEEYIAVDSATDQNKSMSIEANSAFFIRDKTSPDDLLPKDAANSTWAQVAPAGQGDIKNQNFLTAGFLMGTDTIGVARKNPNLTLRAEPANPKLSISPWNNSSIEPDQFRKGFELDSSA